VAPNGRQAAVIGGNRIPFARSNGPYQDVSNHDMLTAALEGLVARFGIAGERMGEVVAGAVLKHARDFNLTREVVLGSDLDHASPAYDIQQACDTGLEAAILVGNKIALGQIDVGIAGGVDTTSDAPIEINDDLRRVLMDFNAARSTADRVKLLGRLRPSQIVPVLPRNAEPRTGLSMGEHTAITARQWGVTREEQDEIAVASHKNAAAAYEAGFFDDLMTPYQGLERDQNLRPDSSIEKLQKLKPVFGTDHPDEATMTAANSTPLSDGASVTLIASDEWAKERKLPVLAHIVDAETRAVDYINGEDGLLTAPIFALPPLLERNGLSLQDFDFYEIHEAFASQVAFTLKAWDDAKFCRERLGQSGALGKIDRKKLNVNGSSLAFGHPFAATGGRIVAQLAKMLHERGKGSRGLISICAAGGNGVVAIMEAA
jgi:acetyl-CoA C-acetyltransferase